MNNHDTPSPPETFADHPVSITELRGRRSMMAKDWTIRDSLIEALREIDSKSGIAYEATHCLLIFGRIADHETGATAVTMRRCGTVNAWESLGMLHESLAASCSSEV